MNIIMPLNSNTVEPLTLKVKPMNQTFLGLFLNPSHQHSPCSHSQCVLSCQGLGQIQWRRSGCGQSAALPPTCPTRAPWPGRGWRGRKPPPQSSSRRTWGRRSASAGGRSSGWGGGSPSPVRWWSWRFAAGDCSPPPWRCSPLTATVERHRKGLNRNVQLGLCFSANSPVRLP